MGCRATLGGIGFALLWLGQATAAVAAEPVEGAASAATDAGSGADSARLGLAFTPTLAVAQICSRDSDVVGCEPGRGFLGFELSGLFPLLPALSLGPFVSAGFEGGARSQSSSQFGAVGAELRVLPYAPSSFWLSARLAGFGVRDVIRVETQAGSDEYSSQAWAPSLGAGLGFDVAFAATYGLSFAWFVDYVMLSSDGTLPEDHGVDWSGGLWFKFGLGMYFDV